MSHSAPSEIKAILESNKKMVDEITLNFLPNSSPTKEIDELYSMMRDYPSRGGKGLRATTCLMWCELFGGTKQEALIPAAALELFQNWILVHDDIEDDSDLRRNQPTLHKKVGVPLAINVGDALHGKMWELLLESSRTVDPHTTIRLLSEFSNMINQTTEGQQIELTWTKSTDWNISEEDYYLMVTKKSAWYTCITPSRLGTICSFSGTRADKIPDHERLMEDLVALGTDLGISFQIVDDILNLTADETKYGKEILGDIYEGKRTLMLLHTLSECDSQNRSRIVRLLSKRREDKTREETLEIFDKMQESDSIRYAKTKAQGFSDRALTRFDSIARLHNLENTGTFHKLRSLIQYLTTRDY